MVRFSPAGLTCTLLMAVLFLRIVWRPAPKPMSVGKRLVIESLMAGMPVAVYVTAHTTPWNWSSYLGWLVIILSAALLSTVAVRFVASRVEERTQRVIACAALGLLVGAATVSAGVLVVRELSPDIMSDSAQTILLIGAVAGALAGVFWGIDRQAMRSAM